MRDYRILPLPHKYSQPPPLPSLSVPPARIPVRPEYFTENLTGQLRTLKAQYSWIPLDLSVLPRRLAPILPRPYSARCLVWRKDERVVHHSESPRHACAHCEGFVPAASRRTWALVSVPIWGRQLPLPPPIIGLVVRYTTNYLIGRSLILRR